MTEVTEQVSQELEYPDEASRTRARAKAHSGPLDPLKPVSWTETQILPEAPKERLKPGVTTRATEWVWECVSCGETVFLWSKARAVQCVSGCGSRAFRILAKQWSNEPEDTFLARVTKLGVPAPYTPRWDSQGNRLE